MGILTVPQNFDPAENDNENDNENENPTVNTPNKSKYSQRYYSDVVSSHIVDAVTGAKYPWRVGTKNEERFFRVTNTVNDNNYQGRMPRKAFYETPYAYMRHKRVVLDEAFINKWYENIEKLYPGQYENPTLDYN